MLFRFCAVVFLSMLLEIDNAAYTLALTAGRDLAAALIGALCPFICLIDCHWFIEARTLWKRFLLVLAASAGYFVGTMIVTTYLK